MSDQIEGLPSAEEVVGLEAEDIEFIQQGFGINEILSEEQQAAVVSFLAAEYDNIEEADREELEREWDIWRRQRIARPESETKDTPWPNACFHPDVEVLTDCGWAYVKDVKTGDKVLSRNMATGEIAYQPVTETQEYWEHQDLVWLRNLYYDIQVTRDHKFHLVSKHTGKEHIYRAQDILDRVGHWDAHVLPLTGVWSGEHAEEIFGYPAELFLRFLGWYLSEGWVFQHRTIGLGQSSEANPENVERIKVLLDEMGLTWSYRHESQFLVNVSSALASYLRSLGKAWEKRIPREVLALDEEQLRILLDTLIAGDGNITWAKDKHRNYPRMTYFTTSKGLADDLQELAQKIGLSASVQRRLPGEGGKIRGRRITGKRVGYTVSMRFVKQTRFRPDRSEVETVPYEGPVYDVTTAPWHTIYVRQNGKPLWSGNSNVTVPVSAMHTNGIYAHMKMALSQRRPLLTAKSKDGELHESMEAWTEFLDALIESPFHINYREKEKVIYYETASMGTQVVEIPWEERRVNFKRREGDTTEVVSKVIYEGPQVVPYKIEDVFVYPHWDDVQEAPYVIFRHRAVPRYRLEELGTMGFFENVDKLEGAQREELIDNVELEQRRFKQDDDVPDDVDEWDIFKAYYRFDADEDGLAEDLIVWFEPETSTVLRVEYNEIGWRPIVVFPYFKVPGNFYGMGVGHMTRDIQEEVDTMHNLGINSSVLSSLQMFVTKPGSGIGPNEQFYPLKQINAQNPREDFMPVSFPDVSGSTMQREQIAQQYAQQFTGASEAMMGLPDQTAKSGTSASLQTFLAQQGNKIFNTVLQSVTDAISQMGLLVTLQLVANGEKVKARLLDLVPGEKQEAVARVLDMDVEDVPLKMSFTVQTTDVDETEDAKRQSILTMTQLYSQYTQEILQLLPMLESQQVPATVKQFVSQIYEGRTKLMEQTMELFGELDPESFTPFVKHIAFMNDQMEQRLTQQLEIAKQQQEVQGEQAAVGQGAGVPAGPGGQPPGGGQGQDGMGMAQGAAGRQGGAGNRQAPGGGQQQGTRGGQTGAGQGNPQTP